MGTFVIEIIAGPKFWTIPFFKKNEKKSVNFNLSIHSNILRARMGGEGVKGRTSPILIFSPKEEWRTRQI